MELDTSKVDIENIISPFSEKDMQKLVYHYQDACKVHVVAELLEKYNLTVATVESCTGGLLANVLTNVAGSSNYMMGGVVAYNNSIKIDKLGIPAELIDRETAVCPEVAKYMAEKIRRHFGVDIALSTTGIAGPGTVRADKPVGLVYMAVATAQDTIVLNKIFKGNRIDIKFSAVKYLLQYLAKYLRSYKNEMESR